MKKVMVVEDDAKNLELVTRFLKRGKFEVFAPANVDETLAMAVEELPDVILMDLMLNNWNPSADGCELTVQLRRIPALTDVPIIAFSGKTFDDQMEQAFQAGCNEFVEKPVDFLKLIARLKQLTE